MSQAFKKCPSCGVTNNPLFLVCQKCGRMLADVPIRYPADPKAKVPVRPREETSSRMRLFPVLIVIVLLIVLVSFLVNRNSSSRPSSTATPTSKQSTSISLPTGLGTIMTNGEVIGVNDGSYAPSDLGRDAQEVAFKQQAFAQLKKGNSQGAISQWQEALGIESNDAEALIYIENQHVLASGKPHITLITGVAFTPPFPDTSSENDLQGIYVAQHEYNNTSPTLPLYILIANVGSNVTNTTAIAQQIVRIAHADKTVVGVIGWRYSAYSLTAVPVLAPAKIPLISSQSTSDKLSHILSPYFFRVVAPNQVEAQVASLFAQKNLHITHPVIFVDTSDTFSQNLTQDFKDQFAQSGHPIEHEESFVTDKQKSFSALIQDATKYNPDAFIFTSRSNADAGAFQDALPTSGPFVGIPTIAGSGSYAAHKNSYGRWYFIASAFHDMNAATPIAKQFAQEYSADFNTHSQKPAGYYGYTLADDHAILAYDATSVVLKALQIASTSGKTAPTPQDVADMLAQITGTHTFQGVSGQISFGPNHDPTNKVVLILFVSNKGNIGIVAS